MRRVRNRMQKPAPLGDVLREALKASNIKVDLELLKLWEQWAELVGPDVSQNARPEAIKDGLLLVNVSSAPWMQQLQYLKSDLVEKLNSALGKEAVEDIRFKIGRID